MTELKPMVNSGHEYHPTPVEGTEFFRYIRGVYSSDNCDLQVFEYRFVVHVMVDRKGKKQKEEQYHHSKYIGIKYEPNKFGFRDRNAQAFDTLDEAVIFVTT